MSTEENGQTSKAKSGDNEQAQTSGPSAADVKFAAGAVNLGGIFKGFSGLVSIISDMAEKAEQASDEQGQTKTGEYHIGDRERGFVIHWGINTGTASEETSRRTEFGGRPSPFVRPTSRPTPTPKTTAPGRKPAPRPNTVPLNSDLAPTLREPYIEIHDEVEEGQMVVVAELPDVTPENLQVEVYDDVLILRAQGSNCRYEKEVLLPAMVEPEPISCNFQNGLLEIRLRRLKAVKE